MSSTWTELKQFVLVSGEQLNLLYPNVLWINKPAGEGWAAKQSVAEEMKLLSPGQQFSEFLLYLVKSRQHGCLPAACLLSSPTHYGCWCVAGKLSSIQLFAWIGKTRVSIVDYLESSFALPSRALSLSC